MKKSLLLFKNVFLFIWSYWYYNRWHIKRHLGFTIRIHTCFYYDSNYEYYNFSLLPSLSIQLRYYTALKYEGRLFDYLMINFSFLFFHMFIHLERKG